MDYRYGADEGHARAKHATAALETWTGVKAEPVYGVKPPRGADPKTHKTWEPVSESCWKEICEDKGEKESDRYYLLIVDEDGYAKTCTQEPFDLPTILKLAERAPLPVASPGTGELWHALQHQEDAGKSRA